VFVAALPAGRVQFSLRRDAITEIRTRLTGVSGSLTEAATAAAAAPREMSLEQTVAGLSPVQDQVSGVPHGRRGHHRQGRGDQTARRSGPARRQPRPMIFIEGWIVLVTVVASATC